MNLDTCCCYNSWDWYKAQIHYWCQSNKVFKTTWLDWNSQAPETLENLKTLGTALNCVFDIHIHFIIIVDIGACYMSSVNILPVVLKAPEIDFTVAIRVWQEVALTVLVLGKDDFSYGFESCFTHRNPLNNRLQLPSIKIEFMISWSNKTSRLQFETNFIKIYIITKFNLNLFDEKISLPKAIKNTIAATTAGGNHWGFLFYSNLLNLYK